MNYIGKAIFGKKNLEGPAENSDILLGRITAYVLQRREDSFIKY